MGNLTIAGYKDAVVWIAENDESGSGHNVTTISGYLTTTLVADLKGVDPEVVARDIWRYREKHGYKVS